MSSPTTLFEVSWEVCNKIGGIHTVLSTKAKTLVDRMGDDYVAVGPWLLSDPDREVAFEEEEGFSEFCESCREMGVPVRVGRWQIPGRPRTILVEFSQLYEQKDAILAALWEDYAVDSMAGQWDYVEPVLFGYAAGKVIERWWEVHLDPYHRRGLAHAHEWMTGSALLYLKNHVPSMGTVFTTHATMLGRALSSLGHSPEDGLGDKSAEELAKENDVVSKHSIEGVCARQADVFTTVSQVTAREAELLHARKPEPITYNGIDLDVIDELAGETTSVEVRRRLGQLASCFLGEEISDAAHVCISGRYEFHNKGVDVLLESLARIDARPGRPVVAWLLVPAGNSGLKSELKERLAEGAAAADGPLGVATHNLFDEERDAIHEHCDRFRLDNRAGARVRVIHVPIYLTPTDGLLNLPYEAVLRGMDLTCFPSYYEPWGYTPQESLALGVPTITSDYAGFGRWAQGLDLGPEDGITVLARQHCEHEAIVEALDAALEGFLREGPSAPELAGACRATAARTAWADFVANYETAYATAGEAVRERGQRGVPQTRRPKVPLAVQAPQAGARPRLFPFDVSASLPPELRGLATLARNFLWCWDPEAPKLFEELSPKTWAACGHKPLALLRRAPSDELDARAADADYVARLERTLERTRRYLADSPQPILAPSGAEAITREHPIAYFCAEFGIHESMPIYSGGLGVLAGDHLKSASDLGLPFVAVGIFYAKGYLTQRVTPAGDQLALDAANDPRDLPLELLKDEHGAPLEVELGLPGRRLRLRAWRAEVGRVSLFLLDANTPSNREEDRDITSHLYGGDSERRMQQEIVLGRGGFRLLRRLGVEPSVYHMNEGHAAFLGIERVADLTRAEGLTIEEATALVRATTVFTTHTPVPAGHDRFGEDLLRRYFSDAPERLGVPFERLFALGQSESQREDFNMTYLALRFSSFRNGVAKLHGIASRELLHPMWPGLLESEVPVHSITNGVHLASWVHPDLGALVGAKDRPVRGADFAERGAEVDLEELWALRRESSAQLVKVVRESLRRRFLDQHDSPVLLTRMLDGLEEDAMLIGFARRFAPYKRAHLLFRDPERLRELLDDEERPVRILIAGKAHPADGRGKEILSEIVAISRQQEFAGKIVFVEDYSIQVGRALVRGVDVWLNTPTRMLEASGTSGMKAAANGGLNLSIGDGWWPEAYDGENGWQIGDARAYEDQELQDQLDSEVLYRLLEEELVPLFYERDAQGIPRGWLEKARHCLATVPPVFDTDRMVGEYLALGYLPLATNRVELLRDKKAPLKELARERARIRKAFAELSFSEVRMADLSELETGDPIDLSVDLRLGSLRAGDVVVELVLQHGEGPQARVETVPLAPTGRGEGDIATFEGTHRIDSAGAHAYGVRARPASAVEPGDSLRDLVLWA